MRQLITTEVADFAGRPAVLALAWDRSGRVRAVQPQAPDPSDLGRILAGCCGLVTALLRVNAPLGFVADKLEDGPVANLVRAVAAAQDRDAGAARDAYAAAGGA